MAVLSLKNVCYSYEKNNAVLNKINISFETGKLYVIMGKSGAGKSTLLSLLSGLDNPQKGDVLYKETTLRDKNKDNYRKNDIGILFQGYNLLNTATGLDNVLMPMEICECKVKNKKSRAYELLENVGIDKQKANRRVLKLSGGEQQRVAIAAAIAHNPEIIIADEPTGNLDADTEKDILKLLSDLVHQQSKCVIVVTHSMAFSDYADELWGLNKGRLNIIKKKQQKI